MAESETVLKETSINEAGLVVSITGCALALPNEIKSTNNKDNNNLDEARMPVLLRICALRFFIPRMNELVNPFVKLGQGVGSWSWESGVGMPRLRQGVGSLKFPILPG